MGRFRQRVTRPTIAFQPNVAVDTGWNIQSPGYLSALPRHSGYGMDSYGGSGRDGAEGRVTVFLLDDFTTGSVVDSAYPGGYTRLRHGNTAGYEATSGPKICVPIRAGTVQLNAEFRPGSYQDFYGQFAPGDGLVFRNTIPNTVVTYGVESGIHSRWWHCDFRVGDDSSGVAGSDRDAMYASGAFTTGEENAFYTFINCAFMWSVDEIIDGYYGMNAATFLYCVLSEALHKSIHDEGSGMDSHGAGPIFGQANRWNRLSFQRNIFAHLVGRQPFVAAIRFAYANNIIYNPGDTDGNLAGGVELSVDYDAASPYASGMYTNFVRNLIVKGPDGYSSFNALYMQPGVEQPSGSQGYIEGNAVSGWSYANQDALKVGSFPVGWSQGSVVTAAWPGGWGSALEGINAIGSATNPNDFSQADMISFATLMAQSVGPNPGSRTSADRAGLIANQVLARLSSSGSEGNTVNSVSGTDAEGGWVAGNPVTSARYLPNAGGFPTPSGSAIDPFSPGSEWYSAIPMNGSAPDDRVQTSGTFSNGITKVGYTALEVWAIEQHWYRGGK